ncbi:hypothetical protein RN001_006518 [Aquatica leii]|uniref:Iporin n=1 Tax=Aquatica leii TaxID=1421715 RepID=A0AAN7SJV7_9COLE|nr:hypothetical protein RN001_006518 [Aquatica leii]
MKYIKYPQGCAPSRSNLKGYVHRFIYQGKAMGDVVVGGRITAHSPDSDCNSNHPGSTSCLSNTSSQDIDFIQDNSDYQWFLDYNYRDGSTNHHTSILSLSEPYDSNDVGYYDALAKNMDANLAEADMESFRTEDIHALLTNLPAMCTDPLSQDNRQGESFASVSGSMMAKFDFDSSISPHSSSQGDDSANSTSMSICKSELLFSPVKEIPMPGANFSVDSLDCELMNEHDIMLTCQANKDNYTIAFEGSLTMYSEDSDYHDTDKSDGISGSGSIHWASNLKTQTENLKRADTSMVQSDSGGFTTWSKLKKRTSDNQLKRHPSGNNNSSIDNNKNCGMDNVLKSQSMPNLYKQKLRGLLGSGYLKNNIMVNSSIDPLRRRVKVFDIQHQTQSSSLSGGSLVSDMATSADCGSTSSESNKQPNLNLVKLFMKQKSISAEGMSTAMDQSSVSDNWPTQSVVSNESTEGKHLIFTETKGSCFEDSLLVDQKGNENCARTHELIIEEQEEDISRSESVEQLSESISKLDSVGDSYEREHNAGIKFNVNNNNSIEQKDVTKKRRLKVHSTQTRRNNSLGVSLSSDSSSLSSFTPSDHTDVKISGKTTSTQIPVHLMNKSMQTSCFIDKSLNNAPYKLNCHKSKDFVKVVQPSFLNKLKNEGQTEKPVYILYPNYVLPDLQFLNEQPEDVSKIFLMPQRGPNKTVTANTRPFSCNDIEALKKKGFGHVRDWDSLNFLLPNEYRKILAGVPEIADQIKKDDPLLKHKPTFCTSPPIRRKTRPTSCDCMSLKRADSAETATTLSSSSSTNTQPSSGYRGSSTMLLTDSQNGSAPVTNFNPLFVYRYDSVTSSEASLMNSERQRPISTTAPPLPKRSISLSHDHKNREIVPPRPPLPKGILRKSLETAKLFRNEKLKRYSMFDASEDNIKDTSNKRFSLPEQYYVQRHKRLSETEDEGVDAGTSSSSLDEQPETNYRIPIPPHPKTDILLSHISCDELLQLEEYLKMSGLSSSDPEDLDEEGIIQLRSCVSKFLSLKINQESGEHFGGKKSVSFAEKVNVLTKNQEVKPPNNSPNASAFSNQRAYQSKNVLDTPICEEGENSPENYGSPQVTPTHTRKQTYDLNQKRLLVSAVTDAVEKLIHHFSPAANQSDLITLGDSNYNPVCAKIALTSLCPAIYAVLSDGLKPNLETSFGPISNSVWQVVEASSQQGPLTKALNDLVMRINGEDAITEGLVKFNAFVFGLLNVRSLDAWTSYLRTRESILKKHYHSDSLLLLAHTGGAAVRGLLDTLISALEPLALLPFQFDLLFEYRQLHESLKRMDSYQLPSSPTHSKPPSPTALTQRQWNLMKLANSIHSCSTHSMTDTEEISSATVLQQCTPENTTLPDLVNSGSSRSQCKMRPRSCVDPEVLSKPNFRLGEDVTSVAKKRWSGISLSSKLYQAYDRLAHDDTEEEYTDSLEAYNNRNRVQVPQSNGNSSEDTQPTDGPESLDSNLSDEKPLNGKRFRKLQEKWEKLSGRDLSTSPPSSPTNTSKSKIPRPVTSPVRPPSGIPVPVISPTCKSKIARKVITPPNGNRKPVGAINKAVNGSNLTKMPVKKTISSTRTSRLDQQDESLKHLPRPSSLPYKPSTTQTKNSKLTPPRRAVSSSLGRKPVVQSQNTKMVRTLSHRLPSESGHLPYNEGERLTVILEVDEKWLLCCRGTQKGLVPKSAVIADNGRF